MNFEDVLAVAIILVVITAAFVGAAVVMNAVLSK
jgi:hypothetical protein